MKHIVSNRLYLKLLLSDLISNFGDTLYFIALMTYVTEIKNSHLALSILNFSETLPILATLFLGLLADRTFNKVGMIIKTLWIRALLYLGIAMVMHVRASVMVVLLASIVNLISDTLGQFENGLFYPISNRIVAKSEREETMAFRQTVTSTMMIVYQSLGAVLITVFSYVHLALINSLTFVVSLVMMLSLKGQINNYYQEKTSPKKPQPVDFRTVFADIRSNLHVSLKALFNLKHMKTALLVIPFLNGSLAVIIPLVVGYLSTVSTLAIISPTITIALLGVSTVSGGILGGVLLLISQRFKALSIGQLLKMNLVTVLLSFVALYYQNIYLVLVASFLSNILVSALNPKIGTIIFNNIDETKLATIFGGMVTYFQLGEMVSKLLFSLMVIYVSYRNIAVIYMLVMAIAIAYAFTKLTNE